MIERYELRQIIDEHERLYDELLDERRVCD
jgi:hypothetical protein